MFEVPPIDLSHGAFSSNGEINGFNVMLLSALEDEEKKRKEEEKEKKLRKVEPIDDDDLGRHTWN